ncbi:MAG: MarR family transcriptional regulator [Desulfobacterales bacterium]|nr:MarR family transcriptional regulator [Desulfobacterales bacterium]
MEILRRKYYPKELYRVLKALESGSLKTTELPSKADVSRQYIFSILDILWAAGLISRGESERDKRVVNVTITDKGKRLLAALESLKEIFQEK